MSTYRLLPIELFGGPGDGMEIPAHLVAHDVPVYLPTGPRDKRKTDHVVFLPRPNTLYHVYEFRGKLNQKRVYQYRGIE